MIYQHYRRTDGLTTSDSKTVLCTVVHHTVKIQSEYKFQGHRPYPGPASDVNKATHVKAKATTPKAKAMAFKAKANAKATASKAKAGNLWPQAKAKAKA